MSELIVLAIEYYKNENEANRILLLETNKTLYYLFSVYDLADWKFTETQALGKNKIS